MPGSPTPPARDAPVLTVLTLNLWGANGPVRRRLADLVAYLRARRPQVLALQEVEPVGGVDTAERLATQLGYDTVQLVRTEAAAGAERGEGLAILTDLSVVQASSIRLPEAPRDHPRCFQQVDVELPDGTPVRLGNTHLSWRLRQAGHRLAQATAIRAALADWRGPLVVMGDFNDVPQSKTLRALTGPDGVGLADSYAAAADVDMATFHPDNPYAEQRQLLDRRVDHVLVRGLEPAAAEIVLTGDEGPVVSDHYGVRVDLVDLTGLDATQAESGARG